ncbi:hypothetical protein PMI14_03148 [Acidovorax sp. CF316]|uniref:hypothetical protein n=1 Tax=Acidovorax sp. CF316 TaxID=1144317 RepID=UPI00026BD78F|nr:hypothetical protein [Acidovorax sp. CF316]EJE52170.1 hypothetical protein PMI14_03148 [Acidovorax sp. CF316]
MFETGRWNVTDPSGRLVGVVDGDEYVRDGEHQLYRIDGNELYSAGPEGRLYGFIEGELVIAPATSSLLLRFTRE